jgi:hypothetical protein
MKKLAIASVLLLITCAQNTIANNEKGISMNEEVFSEGGTNSLKKDTCNICFEFISLRDKLVTKKIKQVAGAFDFPINDQDLLTFAGSQTIEQIHPVTISNIDDFRNNFGKLFPDKFLSLLQKVRPTINTDENYGELDWEEMYDSQHVLYERHKLLYKISNSTVVLEFFIENIDDTGKYETTVKYFFTLENCKLKFKKCMIAG